MQTLEIATTNQGKLDNIKRVLTEYEIVGRQIDVEEIQSLDPVKVVSAKAKAAFAANGNKPIIVEDTSMIIAGLHNWPGPYVKDLFETSEMRELVCSVWLKDQDRSAVARVILALFDGEQVHTWGGTVAGKIAEFPRGDNGFGWDDIFIPEGSEKTFAEMVDAEKDNYSMRTRALEEFRKRPIAA